MLPRTVVLSIHYVPIPILFQTGWPTQVFKFNRNFYAMCKVPIAYIIRIRCIQPKVQMKKSQTLILEQVILKIVALTHHTLHKVVARGLLPHHKVMGNTALTLLQVMANTALALLQAHLARPANLGVLQTLQTVRWRWSTEEEPSPGKEMEGLEALVISNLAVEERVKTETILEEEKAEVEIEIEVGEEGMEAGVEAIAQQDQNQEGINKPMNQSLGGGPLKKAEAAL